MSERINILIASPGDVPEERSAVQRVFTRWNERHDFAFLHPKMWESASVPELGAHPQTILNRQLIDECGLLVAILWSRLGTPTPTDKSGTLEEIREFSERKGEGRVMVYFCKRPILHGIDLDEFKRLREFQEEMKSKGLYADFTTCGEFEGLLYQHLEKKAEDVIDDRLPLPLLAASDTQAIATVTPTGLPSDPRLQKLIDFGRTLSEIEAAFASQMKEFAEIPGGGPNKYLNLGAHVFISCAECLDRMLSRQGNSMSIQDKSGIDRLITRLRILASTSSEYRKKFPAFWEEGSQIAAELKTRVHRVIKN